MKQIRAEEITAAVAEALMSANYNISPGIYDAISRAEQAEPLERGRFTLSNIKKSYDIAKEEKLAICQDSGMSVVFAEVGQDIHIEGGFEDAINEGVRRAHREGFLRCSVVNEPLFERKNTGDNTPAIIYTRLVPGDRLAIDIMSKGFGSENTSALKMFVPANTVADIKAFVLETVQKAGPNACPPTIIGVGIGGTMDRAAWLAKRALLRDIGQRSADERYAQLERDWLAAINETGIGPGGLGGATTALELFIEFEGTHIAGLPVAINICCHASRHGHAEL